jgi:hypothetical protein
MSHYEDLFMNFYDGGYTLHVACCLIVNLLIQSLPNRNEHILTKHENRLQCHLFSQLNQCKYMSQFVLFSAFVCIFIAYVRVHWAKNSSPLGSKHQETPASIVCEN